jgi:hypothetical protein
MEDTQREEWNNRYVLKEAEKGRTYFDVAPKIELEPWYKNTKLSSVDTRTVNRKITTHTYTPNWLAKMGVAIGGVCVVCEEGMGIQHILYTIYLNYNTTESNIRKRRHSSVGRNNKNSEGHQNGRLKRSKIN